jgi:tetratricopeptide (TPR) repeat protein
VDQAIERLQRAMRLSPRDPLMFTMQGVTAFGHFFAGRYEEAISWAEKAFWERPNILATLRVAAASYALAGRLEEARKAVARALDSTPTCAFPISKIASAFFAGRKIMQNMQTLCAGPDCRNEPFGTTTHGLRLAKSD